MKRFTALHCAHLALCTVILLATLSLSMTCQAQAAPAPPAPRAALTGDSTYQVPAPLVDQNGRAFRLEALRGKPVLVSMFYNSCQFVCPMLIDTLRLTEQALTVDERANLSVLLVTFDPARDDVKALKSIADNRELDAARWTLARTDATSVRKIAATLGIQYRLLPGGDYNHTTVLILLDDEGRIVGRTKKLGSIDPAFVTLIKRAVRVKNEPAAR